MPRSIGDDEQRRARPQPPCARRVPAARRYLRRCRSSPMRSGIGCVASPGIYRRGARNATRAITRTGSKEVIMMFQLKTLSPEAVPKALAKAERYRLLNEPGEAESICLDEAPRERRAA